MLINNDYVHGHTPVIVLFSDRLELTTIGHGYIQISFRYAMNTDGNEGDKNG